MLNIVDRETLQLQKVKTSIHITYNMHKFFLMRLATPNNAPALTTDEAKSEEYSDTFYFIILDLYHDNT